MAVELHFALSLLLPRNLMAMTNQLISAQVIKRSTCVPSNTL